MSLQVPKVIEPGDDRADSLAPSLEESQSNKNEMDSTNQDKSSLSDDAKKKPIVPKIITDTSALSPEVDATEEVITPSHSNIEHSPVTYLAPPSFNDESRPSSNTGHLSLFTGTTFVPPSLSTEPDNPFAFTSQQLYELIDPKNLQLLAAFGGTAGLLKGLHCNPDFGLSRDEIAKLPKTTLTDLHPVITLESPREVESPEQKNSNETKQRNTQGKVDNDSIQTASHLIIKEGEPFWQRKTYFGINILPDVKSKGFLELIWCALKEKVLIILSIAAIVSLVFGFYQDFGPNPPTTLVNGVQVQEPKVNWVEGVAIIIAIFIVVIIGALNDYQKERQFRKLNARKEDRLVKGIRNGKETMIGVHDILVGDILVLEPGDIVPADGVFLSGHNVRCDESAATGETDTIRKGSFEACIIAAENEMNHPDQSHRSKLDPFILSGSKVSEGIGRYVVTGIGTNSFFGRLMMSLRQETEGTPLQIKLNVLAETIAKLGGLAALLLFVILIIRFFVGFKDGVPTASQGVQQAVQIFIICVTVVVVAVPEGLPLAVTLSLAYATVRMLKDNNLVRTLASCETMGNATCVCSDKTGTLTQNNMTVVAGTLGVHLKFVDHLEGHGDRVNRRESVGPGIVGDVVCDLAELNDHINKDIRKLLNESIAINSTAFEDTDDKGQKSFIGSKTDTALLQFAQRLGWENYKEIRDMNKPVQVMPFSSDRKAMGIVIKLEDGRFRFLVKGASEILMKQTEKYVCTVPAEEEADEEGTRSSTVDTKGDFSTKPFTAKSRELMKKTIIFYASQSLRTIAICYRDFDHWPPMRMRTNDDNEVAYEDLMHDLTLAGIVGIEDPLRPGVREAVTKCQKAGVFVRMVTGDNIITAKSIATQCGIYTPGGLIMEGPKFRKLTQSQMDDIIPRLQVLARSSPEDKKILVTRLKELGEVVAVTGDGTNDGPALKVADIGFSMGIAGTEVAKEASDIVLMDDNFSSIVRAIIWGRSVNDSVKKFLQFQLTVNITAVLLTFISAVASTSESSVLTAVQLLWVNLIMDTLAALALATDPPTETLLNRKPDSRMASLITVTMWKMIIGQSIYQLAVTLVLFFQGGNIFGYDETTMNTLIFNAFVLMQIFNEVNCRRIDNNLNIFEAIHLNKFFIGIFIFIIGGQLLIVEKGGYAFQTVGALNGVQWAICIIFGIVSLPIGVLIRLIPDKFIEKFIPRSREDINSVYLTNGERTMYPSAINDVRNQLIFFKLIRGGRTGTLPERIENNESYLSKRLSEIREMRNQTMNSTKSPVLGTGERKQISQIQHVNRSRSVSSASLTIGEIRRRLSATRLRPPPSPTGNMPSILAAGAMVPSLVATSVGAGGWRAGASHRVSNPTSVHPSREQLSLVADGIEVNMGHDKPTRQQDES